VFPFPLFLKVPNQNNIDNILSDLRIGVQFKFLVTFQESLRACKNHRKYLFAAYSVATAACGAACHEKAKIFYACVTPAPKWHSKSLR
jgi:hypothetical protein